MENSKQKQTAKITQKTAATLYLLTSTQQPDVRIYLNFENTKSRIIIIKLTIHEFFAVDTCRFMCRTTVKKWEVIDSNTLETVDTFSADDRDSVRSWFAIFYS